MLDDDDDNVLPMYPVYVSPIFPVARWLRATGVGRRAAGGGRRATGVGRRATGDGLRAAGIGQRVVASE